MAQTMESTSRTRGFRPYISIPKQTLTNTSTNLKKILEAIFSGVTNSQILDLLSRLCKRIAFPSNSFKLPASVAFLEPGEDEKMLRWQRAKTAKRLEFPSCLLNRMTEKKESSDLFELEDSESEMENGNAEKRWQYTDTFRTGNLILEQIPGKQSNPNTPHGLWNYYAAFDTDGRLNGLRMDCTNEEWMECGKACEEVALRIWEEA